MEQNKRMRILMCHNSTEGILCGVYEAFTSRYGHAYQKLAVGPYTNGDLFSDIFSVDVDTGKAEKVVKAIVSKISEAAWYRVHLAAESDSQEKGEIIYRFLILAFANGSRVLNAMSVPEVMGLHKLSRSVSRETQHLCGFLRFQELQNHILYARLVSRHHVGMFLAEHFQDRMPMENWVIHDVDRDEIWMHRSGREWLYISHPDFKQDPQKMLSASEYEFTEWWKTFTESIAILERKNPKLQMQMLPKRYWKYMPEMEEHAQEPQTFDLKNTER